MSTRREKMKRQKLSKAAIAQVQESGKQVRKRGDTTIENGKFFLDLAKLLFGGIILTGIKERGVWDDPLIISGSVSMLLLYTLGIGMVKYGNLKKNKV